MGWKIKGAGEHLIGQIQLAHVPNDEIKTKMEHVAEELKKGKTVGDARFLIQTFKAEFRKKFKEPEAGFVG